MPRLLASALFAATLVAASFTVVPEASATLIEAGTIEELAQRADDVVSGEVVSLTPYIEDGRVFTSVMVETDDGEMVEIRAYGGRTERLATRVAGAEGYYVGERVIVLAQQMDDGVRLSLGMAFTKFEIVERPDGVFAVRDFDAAELVQTDPETQQLRHVEVEFEREIPLTELLSRIDAARAELPAPDLEPTTPNEPLDPGTPVGP